MSKKFDEIDHELLNERLPLAFDKALLISRKAESIIYMSLVKCLEELSDVAIELETDDPVCVFFNKWNQEGYIDGALSYESGEDGNKLSCRFDLYDIRDTFDTLSTDLFGSIPGDYSKKIDESDLLSISETEITSIEEGFQKINLPKKQVSNKE